MKKIILLAAIAVSAITSSYAQVSFGAQIGANLGLGHADYGNAIVGSAATLAATNDPKVGFLIGAVGEVEFGKLSFRPEFNIVQKGSKNGFDGYYGGYNVGSTGASKKSLIYAEIPLNVVYNLKIKKVGKAFFGLGPAIAIGIAGKDKNYYEDYTGLYYNEKIKFDGKKDDASNPDLKYNHMKRMDIGLNILAGFEFSMHVFAKIGYTHGFSNIDPNKDVSGINSTYKNRGFNICVGYMFGGK